MITKFLIFLFLYSSAMFLFLLGWLQVGPITIIVILDQYGLLGGLALFSIFVGRLFYKRYQGLEKENGELRDEIKKIQEGRIVDLERKVDKK